MTDPYNLTLLGNANGWTGWMSVFNFYSDGIYFPMIVFAAAIIIFSIAKYNLVPTAESSLVACFFGFTISTLFWLFTYNGLHAVSLIVPIAFLIGLGFSVFYIRKKS